MNRAQIAVFGALCGEIGSVVAVRMWAWSGCASLRHCLRSLKLWGHRPASL